MSGARAGSCAVTGEVTSGMAVRGRRPNRECHWAVTWPGQCHARIGAMSYQDEALEESALESAADLAERVKQLAEARREQAETKKALPREIGN